MKYIICITTILLGVCCKNVSHKDQVNKEGINIEIKEIIEAENPKNSDSPVIKTIECSANGDVLKLVNLHHITGRIEDDLRASRAFIDFEKIEKISFR